MRYLFFCTNETENFAAEFARSVKAGDVLCLSGELGTGKTVFTRGLCRGLGYTGAVTSPTFTLMNVYEGGRLTVYHFDLYRLGDAADVESIGLEEYAEAGGVCVLEWPERAATDGLRGAVWVEIRADIEKGENYREIDIRENSGD